MEDDNKYIQQLENIYHKLQEKYNNSKNKIKEIIVDFDSHITDFEYNCKISKEYKEKRAKSLEIITSLHNQIDTLSDDIKLFKDSFFSNYVQLLNTNRSLSYLNLKYSLKNKKYKNMISSYKEYFTSLNNNCFNYNEIISNEVKCLQENNEINYKLAKNCASLKSENSRLKLNELFLNFKYQSLNTQVVSNLDMSQNYSVLISFYIIG